MKRKVDLVVISDVHLGTYGCHARELLQYLKSIQPETLILNGDFIDIRQSKKTYFPKEHLQVLQYILKLSVKKTKVYYITGNHDDLLRRYSNFSAGNIHLRDKLTFALGKKQYWVFHGDIFDVFTKSSPLVARLGGKGYDLLIYCNRLINRIRSFFGMARRSFAGRVKSNVKGAVKSVADFEDAAIRLAAQEQYDVVICGHSHQPKMREATYQDQHVLYLNSGDWVEHLTALEYRKGDWKIYTYDAADYVQVNKRLVVGEKKEDAEFDLAAAFFARGCSYKPKQLEELFFEVLSKEYSTKSPQDESGVNAAFQQG